MPWTIYWDNGVDACGTWSHILFSTKEDAQEYADVITEEYIAEDIWTEDGIAEPYWLELESTPEQIENSYEQSIEYF